MLLLRRRGGNALRAVPLVRRLVPADTDNSPAWLHRLRNIGNDDGGDSNLQVSAAQQPGTSANSGRGRRGALSCALCSSSPPEVTPYAVCKARPLYLTKHDATIRQAPHQADCGHVFCYLCLRTKVLLTTAPSTPGSSSHSTAAAGARTEAAQTPPWKCPTCQTPATMCVRWIAQ